MGIEAQHCLIGAPSGRANDCVTGFRRDLVLE
jgi:hypothetical protein